MLLNVECVYYTYVKAFYDVLILHSFLGVSAMAASGLHSLPPVPDIARDSRQNKKSKWDKVFIF